jgi:hypothetical protein
MLNRRAVALGLIVLLMGLPLFAQTSDKDLLARIRQEEANNSQIMKTEHNADGRLRSAAALNYFNRPDRGLRRKENKHGS